MKRIWFYLPILFASLGLAACGGSSEKTITIAASELPHAKILKESVAPVLKDKGYDLKVTVIGGYTLQNPAVAAGEYDANYFQHQPYLDEFNASAKESDQLSMVVKVHYERLCLYATNLGHKTLENGDSIELVNDLTNLERALNMLKDNGVIVTISEDCYKSGSFEFDVTKPNQQVTFAEQYNRCTLTCIQESSLATSLADYDFGVLPGNTALTGLGADYAQRIVFSEKVTPETLSLRANGVAMKKANASGEKAKALIDAFKDEKVAQYITATFGDSVIYHYEVPNA